MKNKILLILVILAGAVLGSLIGNAVTGIDALNWLSYSKEIGVDPTTLNLIIINLTIGFKFSLSVAQIICMLLSTILYPKLAKAIA